MGMSGRLTEPIDNNWATDDDADDLAACRCAACLRQLPPDGNPIPHDRRVMVVCSICGNKRCPHAEDHRWACTGSNKPNQIPRAILPDDDGNCDLPEIDEPEPIDCYAPWSGVLPIIVGYLDAEGL